MDTNKERFPEQDGPAKLHGKDNDVPKMSPDADPKEEGHVKEWQDRARVVLDAKEAVQEDTKDKQSPSSAEQEDVEEKSQDINRGQNY